MFAVVDAYPNPPQPIYLRTRRLRIFFCAACTCSPSQYRRKSRHAILIVSHGVNYAKTCRHADYYCGLTHADAEGAVHGVVPQPPFRRGGA